MDINIPRDIENLFIEAGWTVDRWIPLTADVEKQIPDEHPALSIMHSFVGLTVGKCGPGMTCATSDIRFHTDLNSVPFGTKWDELLKTELINVASCHHDHGDFFVDSKGRWFSASIVHDAFGFAGGNLEEAMKRLLFGYRKSPMLHPNQESVTIYGDTFTRDSPELFWY